MNSDPSIGTYRIMNRKVTNAFRQFTEVNKYISGLFYWMNFDHGFLNAEHSERKFGKSNYNLKKLSNNYLLFIYFVPLSLCSGSRAPCSHKATFLKNNLF